MFPRTRTHIVNDADDELGCPLDAYEDELFCVHNEVGHSKMSPARVWQPVHG